MKKLILSVALVFMAMASVFATANYVYHEQTANNPGCGANNYMSNTAPAANEDITIAFKVEYQGWTNQIRIYYTTDGTAPSGVMGTGTGTTQVLVASYDCTFNFGGNTIDVCSATIPGIASGTVKYIISAWHSGGGDEIFANSGNINNSANATVFAYTVTPLPISLTSFDARPAKSNVSLEWATASEINNNYFTVERSGNNKNWEAIAKVNGAGTDHHKNEYQYLDNAPKNGINYYRLRQTDFDGNFSMSAIISVQMARIGYSLYPTVAKDIIYLNDDSNVQILIVNSLGQNVLSGRYTEQVDVSRLSQGWYFAQAIDNNRPVFIGRFYKQ